MARLLTGNFPCSKATAALGFRHTIVIHTSHIRWVLSIFSPECFIFLCFPIVHFGSADVPVTHFFHCPASPEDRALGNSPVDCFSTSAPAAFSDSYPCAEVKTTDTFFRGLKPPATKIPLLRSSSVFFVFFLLIQMIG